MADDEKIQDIAPTTEGPGDHGGEAPAHADSDTGGKAHTPEGQHPAGDGPRSDREVGGPVAADDAEPTTGGAKGDIKTRGFEDDPHR